MASRFGSPDPNWQLARALVRCRFTTRALPIFNFSTYANLRHIRIGINRAKNSLSSDTKAAEENAELRDIPTADSSQNYHETKG